MSNIEATIICIDNSDYNRNEDIVPNRFLSQIDCVNVLCCNKTSLHYKNNIGILMMAGDKIKVKVSLTNDIGQLLSCIHDIKLDGTCDIIRSLLIAQLALKHRVDKNLDQKIILFIGSPFHVNEKQLINTGKQLKKNNISVDIISFGNIDKNRDKLMMLFESVNNNDNCRFIECPEYENNLSKFVLNSFLNNNDFNIGNIQDDDQLLNAMQLSLEESQHMDKNLNTTNNINTGSNHHTNNITTNNNDLPTIEEIENMKDIDNELKEALILSLREYTEKNKLENKDTTSNNNNNNNESNNNNNESNNNNNESNNNNNESNNNNNESNNNNNESNNNNNESNNNNNGNTCGNNNNNSLNFYKKDDNFALVNESYKNNFDKNDENKLETSKEKKENESYEKVFKIDKEENMEDTSKDIINEHIYKDIQHNDENNNVINQGEEKEQSASSLIQDPSYISNILGKINPNVNVFDKKEGDSDKEKNKE
ncbi:26S proteasome regulatory subunit RPN10 [Plasmodium falciparum NF54]|uniref:26S proteasome regulatory subunit RPN10, putative n=2 Tax=Plasmodium falciparum TaxID=5833 RepID=Q8IAR6_PLAF7|nr:26S proteasome regulatory subunit RPN10, putative [Plasmodium falciparum 3D7]KAF4330325.1 26S proteasome regulatory subunit RPN10 [Plasmodium falciparum NF54]PKC47436.1 26S proteasome regulatory subunit RPN10 [Plasmodium falciparum NF54]CAD51294.1 26S proteasome regulatory subunit RPN10, putative [Plasmodium falciparum 3D7]|eukprot:XP_001349445.1 26S proteasome regulatory subunit RPN10,putative [Plasmodium falciparum 3D7]